MKLCKNCEYFNTFNTNNFHGICDKNGNLADKEHTCVDFKEDRTHEKEHKN